METEKKAKSLFCKSKVENKTVHGKIERNLKENRQTKIFGDWVDFAWPNKNWDLFVERKKKCTQSVEWERRIRIAIERAIWNQKLTGQTWPQKCRYTNAHDLA